MNAVTFPEKDCCAIGIDMGGTNTTVGLVDRCGRVVRTQHLKTRLHETAQAYLEALALAVRSLVRGETISGIGMGAPNANLHTGEITDAANLPWKGVIPVVRVLSELTGYRVRLTNDANAAAVGEGLYGAAKGLNDYIVVTLGTGLGSGIVANGQLVTGPEGLAGELGHVISVRGGRSCGCGRKGCLETYASATGMVRTAEEWLLARREPSMLHEHCGKITAWDIQQAAQRGDALAREIFAYTGRILGETLADTAAITAPEAIVFYGGLARAGALLLDPVQEHFEANLLHIYSGKIKLLPSGLPEANAGVLGASALGWV
ncbi:MAG: ROK family protein [Sphingobacteriales bacterium]|nr:MAG: ROK family protein [Sphingobacteriales bacterium]